MPFIVVDLFLGLQRFILLFIDIITISFQLMEFALLLDRPSVYYINDVGIHYALDSMCNCHCRQPLRYLVQSVLYKLLIATIKGRGGLIKKEYFWFFQQGSCNCYSLLLAS